MKFTPGQLGVLGSIFFNDLDAAEVYSKVAQAIKAFIAVGDPYDEALVVEFVQEVLPTLDPNKISKMSNELETGKPQTTIYFSNKCMLWFEGATTNETKV